MRGPLIPEGSILIMDEDGTPTLLSPERDWHPLFVIWCACAFPLGVGAGWLLARFVS